MSGGPPDGEPDDAGFDDRARPVNRGYDGGAHRSVGSELRDAVLDLEEPLADLRSALAALDLIASGAAGIERDDMVGLRYVAKQARELADATHRRWRMVVDRVAGGLDSDEDLSPTGSPVP